MGRGLRKGGSPGPLSCYPVTLCIQPEQVRLTSANRDFQRIPGQLLADFLAPYDEKTQRPFYHPFQVKLEASSVCLCTLYPDEPQHKLLVLVSPQDTKTGGQLPRISHSDPGLPSVTEGTRRLGGGGGALGLDSECQAEVTRFQLLERKRCAISIPAT